MGNNKLSLLRAKFYLEQKKAQKRHRQQQNMSEIKAHQPSKEKR